jgi:hypothetical protein
MKRIWNFLNGNKTIIFLGAYTALTEAVKAGILNDSSGVKFTIGMFLALGGGAAVHHAKKGYFSVKKGE